MDFDYIIIGAGSAGCVLANRLSVDPRIGVCLIEAGMKDTNPAIHMPIGYGKTIHEPSISWKLFTESEPSSNGRKLPLPRGKVLGGSSSINGMIYIRGEKSDFNSWANLGCTGWGWDDVLPFFQKAEGFASEENGKYIGGDYGADGPLAITPIRHDNPTNHAMIDAFVQWGLERTNNFNGKRQDGTGYYHVTMRGGKRCSTATAYLKPALKRPNLTLITKAQASKINIADGKAVSVKIEDRTGERTVTANREILISAGAYHSPHLLNLSGIGPAKHLKYIGIDVLADSPEAGENLQDHFMAPMAWEIIPGYYTYNNELRGMALVKNTLKYYLTHKGPMTIPAASVGAFVKSEPALDIPDLQFHALAVTGDLEVASQGGNAELTDYPGLTIGGATIRPVSRGTCFARSSNFRHPPAIRHNFLSASEDQHLTIKAMQIAREVTAQPALKDIIKQETLPGPGAISDDELLDFQRQLGTTMYHPVGTCRMGSDDRAVVDPELRVNGVRGLRVIDASVMPRIVSGNTNAATIMIAEKAADMIVRDL